MKALQFVGDNRCRGQRAARPGHRRRRGAAGQPQRRHLPQRHRAARRALHHPVRLPGDPGSRVVGRGRRGSGVRSRVWAPATGSSASASSARTTSASASAAPRRSSSSPRRRGCTAFRTTCPGPRARSSSRSAAATTPRVRADNLDASDTVLVLGAGPIGLGVVAAAAGKGARVLVAEPSAARGDLARAARRRRGGRPDLRHVRSTRSPRSPTARARRSSSRRAASWPRWRRRSRSPPSAPASSTSASTSAARVPARLGLFQSKELQARGIIGSPGVWPQTLRFLVAQRRRPVAAGDRRRTRSRGRTRRWRRARPTRPRSRSTSPPTPPL